MSRNKAENCCNEVKSYITREGTTMTEVVELLADEHGWSSSVPNLSGKLRRGSLRHTEAVELADVPGYDIVWQKRKQIFCALRIWYLNRIIKENIIWEANRMKQRQISEEMLNAFLSGELSSLLEVVKKDDTLDLELRGDSVNIYYRGGSLFKITGINNVFSVSFDTNYCTEGSVNLSKNPSPAEAVANIPFYKQAMDWWFHAHPKYEREFQQVIARENNNHGKISNGTDYYIADIEFADGNARFDMVALKWLSKGSVRKDTSKVSLALIEVKYGDGALKGTAGIAKHLEDFQKFLGDKEKVDDFCQDMSQVFTQKCKMGLVTGLNENQYDVKISPNNPEVIFIFANHDPASKILPTLIEEIEPDKYLFPIMIARASNMGYGLYVEHLRQVKKNK